jgi:hypothetical protein
MSDDTHQRGQFTDSAKPAPSHEDVILRFLKFAACRAVKRSGIGEIKSRRRPALPISRRSLLNPSTRGESLAVDDHDNTDSLTKHRPHQTWYAARTKLILVDYLINEHRRSEAQRLRQTKEGLPSLSEKS